VIIYRIEKSRQFWLLNFLFEELLSKQTRREGAENKLRRPVFGFLIRRLD